MSATTTDELREFLAWLVKDYGDRWEISPYGGPDEVLPSDLDRIVTGFINAFEEKRGVK